MPNKTISRRDFVKNVASLGLAGALASCQSKDSDTGSNAASLEGRLLPLKGVDILVKRGDNIYREKGNIDYVEVNNRVYCIHPEQAKYNAPFEAFVNEVYSEQGMAGLDVYGSIPALKQNLINEIAAIMGNFDINSSNLMKDREIAKLALSGKEKPKTVMAGKTYGVPIITNFQSLEEVKGVYTKYRTPILHGK